MSVLYSLKNVVQRFGDREVLNIPELTLKPKRIYVLQGPNGAGKTTLMRILSFMDNPVDGDIFFMGEKVLPAHAGRFRARVVWVPQTPVMFTGTLLYNVEYPMRIKGVSSAERKGRAMELLESVNLANLAKAPAHKLSGGESQRGSIARALAAGAQVILFDEPTASVDYRSREEILRLIRSLHEERGLSLIVTTHDAALAQDLGQERITLFDGKLADGLPRTISSTRSEPAAPLQACGSAKLAYTDGSFTLQCLTVGTTGMCSEGASVVLRALSEVDGGFLIRIVPESAGHETGLDLFLPLAENQHLVRQLTLGCRLHYFEVGS